DVRRARSLGSAGRDTDYFGICIDPEDATGSTDELSDEEGHVPRAAPDVEDSHARTNPRILEEVARQRLEELRTILQAPRFVGGPAHDVRTISASMLVHGPLRALRRTRGSRPPHRTVARIGRRRSTTYRLRAPASRIRSARIVAGVTIHAPDAFPARSTPEFLGLSAEPAGSACHYQRAGAG